MNSLLHAQNILESMPPYFADKSINDSNDDELPTTGPLTPPLIAVDIHRGYSSSPERELPCQELSQEFSYPDESILLDLMAGRSLEIARHTRQPASSYLAAMTSANIRLPPQQQQPSEPIPSTAIGHACIVSSGADPFCDGPGRSNGSPNPSQANTSYTSSQSPSDCASSPKLDPMSIASMISSWDKINAETKTKIKAQTETKRFPCLYPGCPKEPFQTKVSD